MRFTTEIQQIAWDLEIKNRYAVLQPVYGGIEADHSPEDWEALEACHLKKIDISDAIYVVNIGGYIGNHTKQEIEHAKAHNKEIMYHETDSL